MYYVTPSPMLIHVLPKSTNLGIGKGEKNYTSVTVQISRLKNQGMKNISSFRLVFRRKLTSIVAIIPFREGDSGTQGYRICMIIVTRVDRRHARWEDISSACHLSRWEAIYSTSPSCSHSFHFRGEKYRR